MDEEHEDQEQPEEEPRVPDESEFQTPDAGPRGAAQESESDNSWLKVVGLVVMGLGTVLLIGGIILGFTTGMSPSLNLDEFHRGTTSETVSFSVEQPGVHTVILREGTGDLSLQSMGTDSSSGDSDVYDSIGSAELVHADSGEQIDLTTIFPFQNGGGGSNGNSSSPAVNEEDIQDEQELRGVLTMIDLIPAYTFQVEETGTYQLSVNSGEEDLQIYIVSEHDDEEIVDPVFTWMFSLGGAFCAGLTGLFLAIVGGIIMLVVLFRS